MEEAVNWLKEMGLLNDALFAKKWVEGRKDRYGSSRLYSELIRKGVGREIAREVVSQIVEEEEWKRALDLGQRRLASIPEEDPRRRVKLASFLRRRGFSWETIERVLRFLFPSP